MYFHTSSSNRNLHKYPYVLYIWVFLIQGLKIRGTLLESQTSIDNILKDTLAESFLKSPTLTDNFI